MKTPPQQWRGVVFGAVMIAALLFSVVVLPPAFAQEDDGTDADADTQAQKEQLEQELQELEQEIARYRENIEKRQRQARTLERDIAILDDQIRQIELEIRAADLAIQRNTNALQETRNRIAAIGETIERERDQIAALLREVHAADSTTLVEMLLRDDTLSDFFTSVDSLRVLQSSLQSNLAEIRALREELQEREAALEEQVAEQENLLALQQLQRQSIAQKRQERQSILAQTRGEEQQFQQILNRTQQDVTAIRNQLFVLEGGGSGPLTFAQAYELAQQASAHTGIRPAFLMSIIKQESNFGHNVGQCFWRQAVGGFPVMHPERDQPAFAKITAELGIDPDQQKVSCPWTPGGTRPSWSWGGAMGPAQFIPSTWMGYKDAVTEILGHPASPWRPQDAFLASALKLSRGGATSGNERCAALTYFSGRCNEVYGWYADQVLQRAAEIERQIAVLEAE